MYIGIVMLLFLLLVILLVYTFYKKTRKQTILVAQTQQENKLLNDKIINLKKYIETQNKYGLIENDLNNDNQVIDVEKLLQDVKAVNLDLVFEKNLNLIFPEYNSDILRIYGNKFRLMQILSGVLHEIIWQVGNFGTIELKVSVNYNHKGLHQLVFKFIDNGFYNGLEERGYLESRADVRCKAWSRIFALIEQEQGSLEYVHTAYAGNSINLSIPRKVINNVVSLDSYCQDL